MRGEGSGSALRTGPPCSLMSQLPSPSCSPAVGCRECRICVSIAGLVACERCRYRNRALARTIRKKRQVSNVGSKTTPSAKEIAISSSNKMDTAIHASGLGKMMANHISPLKMTQTSWNASKNDLRQYKDSWPAIGARMPETG